MPEAITAMDKSSSAPKSRKVTPPSPSYMSNDQFANYLSELRKNRVARPGGARPLPSGARPAPKRMSIGRSSVGRESPDGSSPTETQSVPAESRSETPTSTAAGSISSRYSVPTSRTRDFDSSNSNIRPLKPSEVVPSATYIERGHRWMEKEEASSLRDAMEEMDLKRNSKTPPAESSSDDESRLYNAALDEAAELVWQHQHPTKKPEPDAPYRYRSHLRKNSYAFARTASAGYGEDGVPKVSGSRSVSDSSTGSESNSRSSRVPTESSSSRDQARQKSKSKAYGSVGASSSTRSDHRRRSSLKRNISGEVQRPFSGDQIWEEPEPPSKTVTPQSSVVSPETLTTRAHNPLNRPRPQGSREEVSATKSLNRVDIYRNPPTQSRNAQYTTNTELPKPSTDDQVERKHGVEIRGQDIRDATSMKKKDRSSKLPEPTAVSDSPGRPIVSFDANWKAPDESTDTNPGPPGAAASPSRFQSNVPPQPRVVDIPSIAVEESRTPQSRPPPASAVPSISVGADDEPPSRSVPSINVPSIAVDEPPSVPSINIPSISVNEPRPRPLPSVNVPSISVDASPSVPAINVPSISVDEPQSRPLPSVGVPSIAVNEPSSRNNVPSIVTPDRRPAPGARALPTPGSHGQRAPRPSAPGARGHWSPAPGALSRQAAMCHECGFPIEGRFVALAGSRERFHPQCLRCFTCGISLEAMEISPEPDQTRAARLDRIRRRAAGEILDETPGMTMAEDGDERIRFFCHLDWHEQHAPRCKHCKTPILGEHIVALGEHWHYGHFFCAECGDPFEQGMTHIEKDGYAWCVKCQTKRTERRAPKCKKCRIAVIGQYIQALGGEWHDHCFRCAQCQGGFDDGQIFPKEVDGGMVVLCTGCRMRELKQ